MAIADYYVSDAGNNANTGASWAQAWRSPEYALDTGIPAVGQGASGDRLSIRGSHTLTKNLGTCAYFSSYTTSSTKPFVYLGEGVSTILDGNATYSVHNNTGRQWVSMQSLWARNCGSQSIYRTDAYCSAVDCRISGASSIALWLSTGGRVIGCELYGITGFYACYVEGVGCVEGCYLRDTGGAPSATFIYLSQGHCERNVIAAFSGFNGVAIDLVGFGCRAVHNSLFAAGGTGTGISVVAGSTVIGNVVSGLSGAGAIGIKSTTVGAPAMMYNAAYNCTTAYSTTLLGAVDIDNETLAADPFTDAANADFSPVDTGNMKNNGWPTYDLWLASHKSYPWKGAIQPQPSGGSVIIIED